ncbi:TPA: cell division protein ZapA, partial [Clostridium perfringens]|nr:cell division protein ZapA [Clostridium perfringens]
NGQLKETSELLNKEKIWIKDQNSGLKKQILELEENLQLALEEKDALGKKISEDMEVEMKALKEEAKEVKAEMEILEEEAKKLKREKELLMENNKELRRNWQTAKYKLLDLEQKYLDSQVKLATSKKSNNVLLKKK